VIATALTLVDADGLNALTIRRLGTESGVDPMAAYRHVTSRADLLRQSPEAEVT
jgi:AcrR family transcriptional regulator